MSAAGRRPASGLRPRTVGIFLALMAGQVALVFLLSGTSLPPALTPRPGMRLQLVRGDAAADLFADPTLLALPSAAGFAGAAWRQAADPVYTPRDWEEPPRWLARDETLLGRALASLPAPVAGAGLALDKPAPELIRRPVPPVPLPEATRVRLEGDLAGRVWLQAPALTDVTHSNILTDTVLRLTVHPEGWVWSAVLLRGSGLASADRQALDQVRRARLRPGAPGPASAAAGWGWGRMVVLWHTRAPEPVTRAAVPPGP